MDLGGEHLLRQSGEINQEMRERTERGGARAGRGVGGSELEAVREEQRVQFQKIPEGGQV